MPERQLPRLPAPRARRATVVGAGSFGTAVAVVLARGGMRTTLLTRTPEQAERITATRRNATYMPEVELPRDLRVEHVNAGVARADVVLLGVPSHGLAEVIAALPGVGLRRQTAAASLAKGLAPPHGLAPTLVLSARFGPRRVGGIGGPAHAHE